MTFSHRYATNGEIFYTGKQYADAAPVSLLRFTHLARIGAVGIIVPIRKGDLLRRFALRRYPIGILADVLYSIGTRVFQNLSRIARGTGMIRAFQKAGAFAADVDAADTLYELNYELVKILAAVYGDDEIWALVRYASTMDGGGNMGWVKIPGLTEYTEENKALLRYPVTVKEGCKDAETGKELMPWEYALGAQTGEYVKIGNEAGSFLVKPEDIIYPSTVKTTDGIWGEWEK